MRLPGLTAMLSRGRPPPSPQKVQVAPRRLRRVTWRACGDSAARPDFASGGALPLLIVVGRCRAARTSGILHSIGPKTSRPRWPLSEYGMIDQTRSVSPQSRQPLTRTRRKRVTYRASPGRDWSGTSAPEGSSILMWPELRTSAVNGSSCGASAQCARCSPAFANLSEACVK